MFLSGQQRYYAPETEAGAGDPGEAAPPIPLNERPADGPGSGRGDIRKELEKSIEAARTPREKVAKDAKEKPRAARGVNHQEEPEVEETPEAEAAEVVEGEEPEKVEPVEAAPDSLAKEAKADWGKTPASVRQAFLKREQDMAKGVDDLKRRYSDLDQVLGPRVNLFRQHGKTPAQAVDQMFAWFDALGQNPGQAFPALAQSFGIDITKFGGGQAAPAEAEGEAQAIPDPVKQYISQLEQKLEQRFGGLAQQVSQQFNQQSAVKTNEILNMWSRDKAHFGEARQMMAHLIGSGAVPPLPDGTADLDTAYDMSINAIPSLRAKIAAEANAQRQKEAKEKADKERKAQQEQADKARRAAGGGVRPGAPGDPIPVGQRKAKGKSVRESIAEAREELNS